jgi:hypothetical protein
MKVIAVTIGLAGAIGLGTASGIKPQTPDFTGGWTASKDAPAGIGAAPTPAFGPRFWLEQKGDRLTVIRPVRDTAVVAAHPLDGTEVRSRIPGGMCLGDAATITSVLREQDTLVHRIHGSVAPGSTAPPAPLSIRHVFKRIGQDRLQVETVTRIAGQAEPVPVATVYTRITDAPPAVAATPAGAAPATLGRLSWLAGTWAGPIGASTVEERWTPASGGSMLAISRTVGNTTGAVTAFEYLCIAERAGSLVYTAMPNGRSPATDFTLTAIDETSAAFENPAHDYPKKIRYAVKPDGALEATISGTPAQRTTTFTFKKQQ